MKKYVHRIKVTPLIQLVIIVCAYMLAAQNLDSGLVAHWTFDEIESGNIVRDVTGNGFDGISKGGCTVKEGRIGNAIEFNAQDAYIEVVPSDAINNLETGTLAFWYNCYEISTGHGEIEPMFYYGKDGPYSSGMDACNGGFVVELGHGNVLPQEYSHGRFWTFFTGGDGSTANGAGNPNPTM